MTPLLHTLLVFVHLAAAIVWLGGMVFALAALRPAAVQLLEPPQRLPLMAAALGRFFRLVAVAVVALLGSGALLLGRVGMANAPAGWHAMLALGLVMSAVFAYILFVPYPALRRAVEARQWPPAGAALGRIRWLVLTNAVLGFAAVAAALSARL